MRLLKLIRIMLPLLICTVVNLPGQTSITGLSIESKKNGAFLRIMTNKPVDLQYTSGWIRKDIYFYLTVMNARADTDRIMATPLIKPVTKLELSHVGESAQFAFELDQPLESFDLYQSDNPPEILVSLRFPITDVLASLQEAKEQSQPDFTPAPLMTAKQPGPTYGKIRSALYLTGASLTVAGIITQDNSAGFSWEFGTGLGLILGTYFFDKHIKPKIHD